MISNFKDVDIANHSGLEEGICRLTIIGEHVNHAENYEELITNTFESQEGKRSLIILFIFLGILSFVKHIIILEKLYICKPVNCKSKLEKLLSNNHLDIQIPSLSQLRNFLYRYREKLIAENYPEVKMFLTEICQKTYSLELKDDELFFISSQFENEKVSILFSTRTLDNRV